MIAREAERELRFPAEHLKLLRFQCPANPGTIAEKLL